MRMGFHVCKMQKKDVSMISLLWYLPCPKVNANENHDLSTHNIARRGGAGSTSTQVVSLPMASCISDKQNWGESKLIRSLMSTHPNY
jgi:hypothetical protein